MNTKSYLKDYASSADKFLDKYFKRKIAEVRRIGKGYEGKKLAVDMLKRYQKFTEGGKKLRGAQIQLGYEIAGGDKKDILAASVSIELIHSYLLMHDDIMDRDIIRRGRPTVHKQYESLHASSGFGRDSYHYGISMGMDLGDLGAYLALEVLLEMDAASERKVKAARYLSKILQRTTYGQGLDILYEHKADVTADEVMEVHLQKTSLYTVGGPLNIGAILGGLGGAKIEAIEKFGEPVGIAFQLRDDELGLFSDEETLGKPIGSDIRQGKNTILKVMAIKRAKGKDRKFLSTAYGNQNLTKEEVHRVQDLTIKTGAFEYSQELSRKLVNKGKKFTPSITKDSYFQDALSSLADFVIERDS